MECLETNQQLSDDLIREILSYLSMPAISKFRCVSKSWLNIIHSSPFAELHLRNYCNTHTISSSNNNDSCVFIPNFDCATKILKITMMLAGCHRLRREFSLDADFGRIIHSKTCIEMVGPINGLICTYGIAPKERLALCNPYLGVTETLPRAPTIMSNGLIFHRVGLGFDPIHKDIRVVQLLCYLDTMEDQEYMLGMVVHVYSRNINTWTIVEGNVAINMWAMDPIAISDNDGLFCHWVALLDHGDGDRKFVVLSFDVCNGGFRTTLLPPCVGDPLKVGMKVFGKGHSLILFSWNPRWQDYAEGGHFLNMWMLNDLGKGGVELGCRRLGLSCIYEGRWVCGRVVG